MAEGKAYHAAFAVSDREKAGFPVPAAQFHAYVPQTLRWIAANEKDFDIYTAIIEKHLPLYSKKIAMQALPGYDVFTKE